MAQGRTGRAAGARRLARRYAVLGRAGVAAAVAILLLCGAGVLVARSAAAGGVVIERAGEPAAAEGDAETGEAPQGGEDAAAADEGAGSEVGDEAPAEEAVVVVHVDGAVLAPGVYALPGTPRVNDAVAAAGGLAPGADTSGINLAAPLADGEKVHVPLEGEAVAEPAGDAAASGDGDAGPVNINTAGVEELDSLPGVGEATARAIVEDRERNGPFSSPEDLMRVSGIGEKKFERMEGMICV